MTEPVSKAAARVLVADDEELVRRLVGRVASEYFESVTLVPGGREALAALAETEFDLVITDIRMPIVDGLAVVQWIRGQQKRVPIIAITGFADPDTETAVAALGAELLSKPFGAGELRDAIERALRQSTL
jgi:two-component system, cell cycle response regulator CpdR